MTQSDLEDLANYVCKNKTETQTIELKSAHDGCPKRLYDTLSSFSNQDNGGVILFGIDEKANFCPVGVYDLQDLQKKVTEQCQQMQPPVRAYFTTTVYEEKWICAAEIPGIDLSDRPCYYKGAGKIKGSFIRVGDADLPMTDYELYSFEAYRKHLHDDERPIERASLESLNQEKLNGYIYGMKLERPGLAQMDRKLVHEMLNISRNDVPTLAAVLNFGIYPQGYLPQLAITAVAIQGKEMGDVADSGARFIDNKRIEGTLSEMVEGAIAFCKRNMKVQTVIDEHTGRREDIPEYPVAAIREAVLNAVIHRDYSYYTEGTPIQIDMFQDRLEIHSPGSLYGRLTVDQLGIAKPDLRNPALAVMAESQTEAENRYSGIPTMRREMKKYGLPAPVFENRRNEFVVTFYNNLVRQAENESNVADKEDPDLLSFCRTPRTRREIADYLGVKTVFYVTSKYINPLVEEGKLKMTIPDKPKSKNQKYFSASHE